MKIRFQIDEPINYLRDPHPEDLINPYYYPAKIADDAARCIRRLAHSEDEIFYGTMLEAFDRLLIPLDLCPQKLKLTIRRALDLYRKEQQDQNHSDNEKEWREIMEDIEEMAEVYFEKIKPNYYSKESA